MWYYFPSAWGLPSTPLLVRSCWWQIRPEPGPQDLWTQKPKITWEFSELSDGWMVPSKNSKLTNISCQPGRRQLDVNTAEPLNLRHTRSSLWLIPIGGPSELMSWETNGKSGGTACWAPTVCQRCAKCKEYLVGLWRGWNEPSAWHMSEVAVIMIFLNHFNNLMGQALWPLSYRWVNQT